MPPTKRKATNALDPTERKRAQNRISQQCLREKNITYIRNLEETIELLQKVATGSDPQDRYSVLLNAHLKFIAENRKLEDALLRLRKKLLSFGQAATAAADDEVFNSIFRRRDAEYSETQQSVSRTEVVNQETLSALNPSIHNQPFEDIPEQYAYGVNGAKYIERVISWRLGIESKNSVPLPFRPTPLQSKNPTHFWGIDLFNWPEIRDQLVLEAQTTDFDELLKDLVLHSVIEPANHSVAVNVLDIFENQVLRRRQHQKAPPRSYFTDPTWTLFHIGPEIGEWYSSEHDIVEEAIFQELDRQINTAPSPDDNPVEESRANDVAKFLGLDDFCEWKLSKDFARKYPKLDCSTDGLTCASCVSDVQDIIGSIHGVSKVTVSLGLLRAQVEFNNNVVTEQKIIEAICSAGYEAHSPPSSDSESWTTGSQLHLEAFRSAWHGRRPNMATLASLGIMLALMQAAADHPKIGINTSYHMDLKPLEAIPILSSSVLGGRLLKTILSQRNRVFASPLSSLVPAMAMVCNKTEKHTSIPIDLLSPGDSVIVNQGEHIPCDGVVESTESALILETWINGSLEPRTVKRNDAVYGGGQVQQGSIVCRATAWGRSARLGQLLTSVVTAELTNSEPQHHRATSWFSSAAILLATGTLAFYLVFTKGSWADGLGRASALLLAACPCSLSLSVPTCKLLATVRASKFGARLVTAYTSLRSAAAAQTILFDKTGTLTHGELNVTRASFSKGWGSSQKRDNLWRAVQEVEAGNTHPVARALFQESHSKLKEKLECLTTFMLSEIKHEIVRGAQAVVTATQPGYGSGTWKLSIGSRGYIESLGVSVDLSQIPVKTRNGITTIVVLAMDGQKAAVFVLEDKVRSDAHP
ncbi:hypothetical protein FDENT_4733 [Fusarium denticulatum]|uniref:HMA domain-containing protein n=1 Tax=Fusarium denticulatum TaxID=48507 RepID=A0A8H5UJS7_9HYPO|nr:hypothetical protein FDENT_4733 [Fusarium denticulatum]